MSRCCIVSAGALSLVARIFIDGPLLVSDIATDGPSVNEGSSTSICRLRLPSRHIPKGIRMRTRIFVKDQEVLEEYEPPKWYRSPEEQYQRASELWPEVYIPSPPSNCMLGSSSGVLLLHVPRSITELWGLVQAPAGLYEESDEAADA